MKDSFGREINYLRLSITDRCNLRCVYCMPMRGLSFVPGDELLSPLEIEAVVRAAAETGFRKIRLTGGEPTLRNDIVHIIERIKSVEGIKELTMTTNGYLLPKLAKPMADAGLDRVNIHIDAVNHDQLLKTMRLAEPSKAWAALAAAEEAGLTPIKLNAVVTRGYNEDDVHELARLTLDHPWHVRFIELMPLGAPAGIALDNLVSTAETIALIETATGCALPQTAKFASVSSLIRKLTLKTPCAAALRIKI